jgi:hypothetical protein
MPTTKYRLAEQVMFLLQDGDPSQSSTVELADIKEAIGQVANKLLKVSHFNETMAEGSRIPHGTMLATYEGVPVVTYAGRSRSLLPAVPLSLPRGVGIFAVHPSLDGVPDLDCEYIPVPPGQLGMLRRDGLLSDLLGQVGYENFGTEIIYNKDLTKGLVPVKEVMMRLAICDVNLLGDYDLLPIPADMEADVVSAVYTLFTGKQNQPNLNDPTAQNKGGKA